MFNIIKKPLCLDNGAQLLKLGARKIESLAFNLLYNYEPLYIDYLNFILYYGEYKLGLVLSYGYDVPAYEKVYWWQDMPYKLQLVTHALTDSELKRNVVHPNVQDNLFTFTYYWWQINYWRLRWLNEKLLQQGWQIHQLNQTKKIVQHLKLNYFFF